jgi:hypothetical protein
VATSGPRYPALTGSQIGPSGDNDWISTSPVGADDGSEAQITAATFDAGDTSYRLLTFTYGFDADVPAGATINGIVVEIDRRCFAGAASDNEVQLRAPSVGQVGSNKAAAGAWPGTLTVATYGGATDTWAAGLTAADVRHTDFGVSLIVNATAANTDIGVDFIRVTVTYTAGADTALAGSSASTSSANGVLTTAIQLVASAASAATAAAVLATSIVLAGSVAASTTAAASLTTGIALGGSATGASGGSAGLSTSIALVGSTAGTSSAAGTFAADTALAGTVSAIATASASLTTAIPVGGDVTGSSGASGVLTTQISLAGLFAGASGADANLTVGNPLVGSTAGAADAAGVLITQITLAGSAAGTSGADATWAASSETIGGHPPDLVATHVRLTVLALSPDLGVQAMHARPEID